MAVYKKGKIVKGKVSGITDYGIFVKLDDEYSGLIHISEISSKYVKDPKMFANINDDINVEILDIDDSKSQMKLSIKNIEKQGNKFVKKRKIVETEHGFSTLAKFLPTWIEKNIDK